MKIKEDYNISTDDVLSSIKSIDDKLSIAREGWVDAPIDKKFKWMTTINQLLDDRLSLMKMRDEYCS
jgi:hypothetical protein